MDIIGIVLLISIAVIPAVVLHEVMHGVAAWCFGDPTAKDEGRLSLNPIKHIDPVGSIILPGALFLLYKVGLMKSLFLFGWAKPVPVKFSNLRTPRLGMAVVALAGPFINVVLAIFFASLLHVSGIEYLHQTIAWAILLNLTLAIFNMVPIPPLDGSRVVMSVLPVEIAKQYAKLEPIGLIIVVVLLQVGLMDWIYPIIIHAAKLIGVV